MAYICHDGSFRCLMDEISKLREEIEQAAMVVRGGGVILYPTDTVWGIGCDATNPKAVERVYSIKRRADHKAMIVLLDSVNTIEKYADGVPEVAYDLIRYSERPLTIVYDHGVGLAPGLLGPDGSIGIRVTGEKFSKNLCRRLRRPLVSTSANISGQPAARCFADISDDIIKAVDHVVDWRRDEPAGTRRPSSVIRLTESGVIDILRT